MAVVVDFSVPAGCDGIGSKDVKHYRAEFGARVGIWRLFDLFETYNIKATFAVPAVVAEICGKRPMGWFALPRQTDRYASGMVSPNTMNLLIDACYEYMGNGMADDIPPLLGDRLSCQAQYSDIAVLLPQRVSGCLEPDRKPMRRTVGLYSLDMAGGYIQGQRYFSGGHFLLQ
ncbi:MAG: hypothetical protein JRG73_00565 [Deltaproteobacteria bacterium]|nr:hypothetical protein [Deltaproteobacteria bacterium]MBW2305397.1 hypothetical protein [Deltaproteobacteria bacterium]